MESLLKNVNLSFTPLKTSDFPLLLKWLETDHVKSFWDQHLSWTTELVKEKYNSYTENYKIVNGEKKTIYPFIIHLDERPIGYIQYYNAYDFEKKSGDIKEHWKDSPLTLAALDFYIGENDVLHKGHGTEILKKFLKEFVFIHFDVCLVDAAKNNKAAIKAYAKAGFCTYHETNESIFMLAKKLMKANPIVILGSSRKEGHTIKAIEMITRGIDVPIINLSTLNISYYDYDYKNRDDDFLPLAEKMIKHDPIILATPIYWYTMSATMKTFIDRWNDLMVIRKDLGQRLSGKTLFLVTSYGADVPKSFEDPFSHTCDYLEMKYGGCFYYYSGGDEETKKQNIQLAEEFSSKIWRDKE